MAPLKAGAVEVSGLARIIDGDTLVISETIIRLHGIDAAETGQRCAGEGHKMRRDVPRLPWGLLRTDVGPVLNWNAEPGTIPSILEAKYLLELGAKRRFESDIIWGSVTFAFK